MLREFLKIKYKSLPELLRRRFVFFHYKRYKWLKSVYLKFTYNQRRYIFLSIARFVNINRPINDYYFEFGCCRGNTMRMAWGTFHFLLIGPM